MFRPFRASNIAIYPAPAGGGANLFTYEPATKSGDGTGHYVYTAPTTIEINRDGSVSGSFNSPPLPAGNYNLTFDFITTGGDNDPWYAIDIRRNSDQGEVLFVIEATAGPYSQPFTLSGTDELHFTLPDQGWSAVYANIVITAV